MSHRRADKTAGCRMLLGVAQHVSRTEIARRAGVHVDTVGFWLRGLRRPDLEQAFALEDAFGVPARSWTRAWSGRVESDQVIVPFRSRVNESTPLDAAE